MNKIGIFPNISHEEYHADDSAISNSYLGRLAKCPANAKVKQEETAALVFGRSAHSYILEGEDAFFSQFAVYPKYMDRRTKEGKQEYLGFLEANRGKTVISEDDYDTITAMTDSIIRHPFAVKLLSEGRSEQSVYWVDKETGIYCKCRPDRIPDGDHGVIVDVKTTTDARPKQFRSSVISYGYDRQAGFYTEGYNAVCSGKVDAFIFIAVEKTEPYMVACYTLSDTFLEYGKIKFHQLLDLEKRCRETDEWPSYQDAELQELELPMWAD
jgi:hypothetical protein